MRRTYKVLNAIFIASLCISAAMVLLFETDILPDGIYHTATGASEFVWATVMELLTICIIPVALRLFRFRHIAERLVSAEALLNWGALRLLMLCVPMVLNTLLYYMYMNVAFGYMGIILFLCMAFVVPTKGRCEAEICIEDNQQKTPDKP